MSRRAPLEEDTVQVELRYSVSLLHTRNRALELVRLCNVNDEPMGVEPSLPTTMVVRPKPIGSVSPDYSFSGTWGKLAYPFSQISRSLFEYSTQCAATRIQSI